MTKIYDELEAHVAVILGKQKVGPLCGPTCNHPAYSLWIDDDAGKPGMESWRSPPVGEDGWKVAHTSDEAIEIVKQFGIPSFIEFDHDLGALPCINGKKDPRGVYDTTMLFLKWLMETYPNAIDSIAGYNIHSRNIGGAANIEAFMNSWKRSRALP